jgi:hypothetical protein
MVALFATPCFAQEIETDGLFSIEGTKWEALLAMAIMIKPFIPIPIFAFAPLEFSLGFYDGEIYSGDSSADKSFYLDMLAVSIFAYEEQHRVGPTGGHFLSRGFGILQPIGIGVMFVYETGDFQPSGFIMMTFIKVDNNWTP